MSVTRLDTELVRRGLVDSRSKAQELIKQGSIEVAGRRVVKPSAPVGEDDPIAVLAESVDVGRGALKLRHAIEVFDVDMSGAVVVDVGASTGGFTQVALEAGAEKVVAIDVGHGQLHPSLAADPRVINLEGHHIGNVTRHWWLQQGWGEPSWVVVDVSFMSTAQQLPHLSAVFPHASMIVLVKPQFEVGRGQTRAGIVVSEEARMRTVGAVKEAFVSCGMSDVSMIPSPIVGKKGNIEYLVYGSRREAAE